MRLKYLFHIYLKTEWHWILHVGKPTKANFVYVCYIFNKKIYASIHFSASVAVILNFPILRPSWTFSSLVYSRFVFNTL